MRLKPNAAAPRRATIGITPDICSPPEEGSAERYELKVAYAQAVFRAGGLPIVLPYTTDLACIEGYLDRVGGILVTGGAFDVPPDAYGDAPREGMGPLKPSRTAFESMLTRIALERNTPVLGICGGMQLLNVLLGGTLIQDIVRELPNANGHEQKHDRHQPHHPVEVRPGTLLSQLFGKGNLMVNSTHHQAPKTVGEKVVISAIAPDGVIEAIEAPSYAFALGVQWHPELLISSLPIHLSLYKAFVHKARETRR